MSRYAPELFHYRRHGVADAVPPCALVGGNPAMWPPDNYWTCMWPQVTCPACLKHEPKAAGDRKALS